MRFVGWFVKRSTWRDPIQFLTITVFTNYSEFTVCWLRQSQMQQILIWLAVAFNKLHKQMSRNFQFFQCVIFVMQIIMHGDEVARIASHLVMSLGLHWDAADFSALSAAIGTFR